MALPVSFRWPKDFVKAIDDARGDIPRSVWVRRAVERVLEAYGDDPMSRKYPPRLPEDPKRRGSVSPSLERFKG